jgi:hypothetical protein
VSGVQHPAPPLVCSAGRMREPIGGTAAAPHLPQALAATVQTDLAEIRSEKLTVHEATRFATYVLATATYATPVLNGRPLMASTQTPKTALVFFLYAQVVQADGASNRNVLLFQRAGVFFNRKTDAVAAFSLKSSQRDRTGGAIFTEREIEAALTGLGLPVNLPLSVIAVEFLPGGTANEVGGITATELEIGTNDEQDLDPLSLSGRPRRILRGSPLVPVAPVC